MVEGIVGTYMANRKLPGSSYGATVISFDKGGEWRAVTPPTVDYLGHPVTCYPVSWVQGTWKREGSGGWVHAGQSVGRPFSSVPINWSMATLDIYSEVDPFPVGVKSER